MKTKLINFCNTDERKIKCIKNECDYLENGNVYKEERLIPGKEYTFIKLGSEPYGQMIFLKEIPSKFGFQSSFFEEIEPYEYDIYKKSVLEIVKEMLNLK